MRHTLVGLFFVVLTATHVGAECLNFEYSRGIYGGEWVNNCDAYVSIRWRDDHSCKPRTDVEFPCGLHIGPKTRVPTLAAGDIRWWECWSDEKYKVLTYEKSYGEVVCAHSPKREDVDDVNRRHAEMMAADTRRRENQRQRRRLQQQQQEFRQWKKQKQRRLGNPTRSRGPTRGIN